MCGGCAPRRGLSFPKVKLPGSGLSVKLERSSSPIDSSAFFSGTKLCSVLSNTSSRGESCSLESRMIAASTSRSDSLFSSLSNKFSFCFSSLLFSASLPVLTLTPDPQEWEQDLWLASSRMLIPFSFLYPAFSFQPFNVS
jgi:hypothetical protein